MSLRHAEQVERVERRREPFGDVAIRIDELQDSAPVGPPVRREAEDVRSEAVFALDQVVVRGEEMSRTVRSGLRISEGDVRETRDLAGKAEKVRGVEILVDAHEVVIAKF